MDMVRREILRRAFVPHETTHSGPSQLRVRLSEPESTPMTCQRHLCYLQTTQGRAARNTASGHTPKGAGRPISFRPLRFPLQSKSSRTRLLSSMIQRGPGSSELGLMSLSNLRAIASELHRPDVDAFLEEHATDEGWLTVLVTAMEVKLV